MADGHAAALDGLPARVGKVLSEFVDELRGRLEADLVSVVLFGSAAEGKLTAASDVNLLVVLRAFRPEQVARIRDAYQAAGAAIRLQAMFLMESELPSAAEMFAQKFADILRRNRILFGRDVLATLKVARAPEIFRLRQILLNLTLRLREAYVARGERPEQVVRILADALGPLRAASATLLELEGVASPESSAALVSLAASCGPQGETAAAQLFAAHNGSPPAGEAEAEAMLLQVIDLVMCLARRAAGLS